MGRLTGKSSAGPSQAGKRPKLHVKGPGLLDWRQKLAAAFGCAPSLCSLTCTCIRVLLHLSIWLQMPDGADAWTCVHAGLSLRQRQRQPRCCCWNRQCSGHSDWQAAHSKGADGWHIWLCSTLRLRLAVCLNGRVNFLHFCYSCCDQATTACCLLAPDCDCFLTALGILALSRMPRPGR